MYRVIEFQNSLNAVAELEGKRGGGADAFFSPQGFNPLPTQRVPPLNYFEISIFG